MQRLANSHILTTRRSRQRRRRSCQRRRQQDADAAAVVAVAAVAALSAIFDEHTATMHTQAKAEAGAGAGAGPEATLLAIPRPTLSRSNSCQLTAATCCCRPCGCQRHLAQLASTIMSAQLAAHTPLARSLFFVYLPEKNESQTAYITDREAACLRVRERE